MGVFLRRPNLDRPGSGGLSCSRALGGTCAGSGRVLIAIGGCGCGFLLRCIGTALNPG